MKMLNVLLENLRKMSPEVLVAFALVIAVAALAIVATAASI